MNFDSLSGIKEDLWSYLAKTDKKIVMYGTGNGADKIINVLNTKGIELYGVFASDGFVRDRYFRGHKVKCYTDICSELNDFIVLVSFASQRDEVLENIYRINSERELYAPDVPVYGDGLFDLEFFNTNRERLKAVYAMLADELSRRTFVYTLAYKLTGKISYLRECETNTQEIYSVLKSTIVSKNYIDIGAYTGDTVEEYTDYFGDSMQIYAFEPDKRNYTKMKQRFYKKNINCFTFNVPAWDKCEYIYFNSSSGRSASAETQSNIAKNKPTPTIAIDSLQLNNIGFVKIDAEGSDSKVIKGMSKMISVDPPCIKVAAYHRNEDYFEIPEVVASLNGGFRLYMRHLKYVPAWDTDFIFDFSKTGN